MPLEQANEKEKIYEFFKQHYETHKYTKEIVILIEKFLEESERQVMVQALNEQRNCLDHLFRATNSPSDIDSEINEAKEHLQRAAFDTFAIVATIILSKIQEEIEPYKNETISNVYPRYFTETRPLILEANRNIAEIRADRSIDMSNGFSEYWGQIMFFHSEYKNLIATKNLFIKYEKQQKRSYWKNWIFGIIAFLIGHVIFWFFVTRHM